MKYFDAGRICLAKRLETSTEKYLMGNHLLSKSITLMGSNTYEYDASLKTNRYVPNGNHTSRTIGGSAYTLTYDAENRLV